ncbi:MAG: putative metal-binding motif-containing protein [Sandaracinaceae bacterium]|nr:putative metal-binding motif-containing protein [Sandaracinaceae bacterium]
MVASYAYFRDMDGDGYGGTSGGVMVGCVPPSGYTTRGGDCDDTNVERHPGAIEHCGAVGGLVDEDCDSAVDEAPASNECLPVRGQVQACIGGVCRPVGCVMGLSDCDGLSSNGCETMGDC